MPVRQFTVRYRGIMHRSVFLLVISLILIAGIIISTGCVQQSAPQQSITTPATGSTAPVPDLLSTVPDVRQSQPYSCGAASLQAVFNYWGIDMREGVLMQELNTTPQAGTPPESIVRVGRGPWSAG